MIKKSFWGFNKSELQYNLNSSPFQDIPIPRKAIVFLKKTDEEFREKLFQVGNQVKTGQKLSYSQDSADYVISPVTGKIIDIFSYSDAFGVSYDGITIESKGNDEWDNSFSGKASLDLAINFLENIPGKFSFRKFKNASNKIDTIIINGMDTDLGTTINQEIVKTNSANIKKGIETLKKITGVKNYLLVVPETLREEASHAGAEVKIIPSTFPNGLPAMIIKNLLNKIIPAGGNPEDIGVSVISTESTANIATTFDAKKISVIKALSIVGKDGKITNVKARIGTPISDILAKCNIFLEENDRIILGGPMLGMATYSKDLPIEPDTDAITIQSESESSKVTDYPCINCGECVRICPARIQVNLLGRFAEFGLYEDAEQYDLHSCIECALCAFVCTARRPLMQYIKLAKHEFGLTKISEAVNEQ